MVSTHLVLGERRMRNVGGDGHVDVGLTEGLAPMLSRVLGVANVLRWHYKRVTFTTQDKDEE